MPNEPFRIVVGADYNLSIEQLKKDIHHVLNRLPKTSRSIVVRANMNDITGLQHDLANISKKLNLTINQIALTANQQTVNNIKTSIEQGLQNAGGIGVHVTARQNHIVTLGAEIERGLLQTGGIDVPLAVGKQSIANLSATIAQALAQINPNDRSVHVITDGNAVEQEIRAVLQRVSQTPLDIHVNLIGLPPQGQRNSGLPGLTRDMLQFHEAVNRFDNLNMTELRGLFKDLSTLDPSISQAIERARANVETAWQLFEATGAQRYQDHNGATTDYYVLDTPARIQAASEYARAVKMYHDEMKHGMTIYREYNSAQNDLLKGQQAHISLMNRASRLGDKLLSAEQTTQIEALSSRLETLHQQIRSVTNPTADQTRSFKQQLNAIESDMVDLGVVTAETDGRFKQMLNNRLGFAALAVAIGLVKRGIIKMYKDVVELDGAMVELRKVTDETDETYNRFLQDASDRANKLGATLKDVVASTADFARLGYDIADAASLADAALVYKNVGDGITDINEATESVIATMQAFGIEASKAMTIVDKMNIIGNTEAISSGGVGDALMNSAAALKAANNSLEESIALIAAANTTAQDPLKVGNTMKTLSMYLRAAKTEAEEAGESTEGMAGSVSELRDEILALTGNRVDIQIDENTFKSTYQILKELSEVWDSLSDISQANILESISGKRNANITASLLENFEIAERALNTAMNSDGSALAENEKVLESITGKLQLMTAAWQEFAAATFDNEAVKFVIQLLTTLLNTLTQLDTVTIGLSSSVLVALSGFGVIVTTLQSFGVPVDKLAKKIANLNLLGLRGKRQAEAGLGTLSLYVAAAAVLITVLSKLYQAWRKAHPTFDELKTKVADAKQACVDLEQQIDSNKDRIAELMELADSGKINIVEQEELDMLKEENELLKQQWDVRKRLLALEEDNLAKAARKKYTDFYVADGSWSIAESDRTQLDIGSLTRNQKILADQNATERERTAADAEITRARTNLVNTQTELLAIMEALDLTLPEDIERYRELQSVVDDITIALDGSTAVAGMWKRTFEDENLYPGVTKLKNEVIKLKEAESQAADEAERLAISDEIKALFSDGVGSQIAADLDIQEEEFDKLINYLWQVAEAAKSATQAMSEVEIIGEVEEQVKVLTSATKEMSETGYVSVDTIKSMTGEHAELAKYLEQTKNGYKLTTGALQDYLDAQKKEYEIAFNQAQEAAKSFIESQLGVKLSYDETTSSIYDQIIAMKDLAAAELAVAGQEYLKAELKKGRDMREIQNGDEYNELIDDASTKFNILSKAASEIRKSEKNLLTVESILNSIGRESSSVISKSGSDYDAIYKTLVDQRELVEQNSERLSRMTGDFSAEQIQMWTDLRKLIISEMSKVADKESERYHYLEDMLWEVNDAIEEVYDNQADAIQNIIDLTREMIEEEYEDQKEAIEKQVDAYNDLIDAKKKALQVDKEANDYNKKVAEKTQEIAKLQSRIALLSLDDSRKAQAEKASLEEELAKLQSDLADLQAERGLELTEEALDESADKFEKAKDKEVEALEAILDDEARLYKETIQKIGNMENSFYQQLEKWAKEHGKDIRELAKDWDVAKNAKKGYTDLDAALSGIAGNQDNLGSLTPEGSYGEIGGSVDGTGSTSGAYTRPTSTLRKNGSYSGADVAWVQDKIRKWQIKTKGSATLPITWNFWTDTEKAVKEFQKAHQLQEDGIVGLKTLEKLDKYHTGGIVGGHGSLRDNEIMSVLETNEIVMANGHKMNLSSLFDNLRNTIGELVSGNLMRSMDRMRAPIPAGGDTIAPQINVTIQHNGTMSDSDAKKYGSMVGDEAIKKLHEAFIKRGK